VRINHVLPREAVLSERRRGSARERGVNGKIEAYVRWYSLWWKRLQVEELWRGWGSLWERCSEHRRVSHCAKFERNQTVTGRVILI